MCGIHVTDKPSLTCSSIGHMPAASKQFDSDDTCRHDEIKQRACCHNLVCLLLSKQHGCTDTLPVPHSHNLVTGTTCSDSANFVVLRC